jgi:endonuclease-3
MEVSVRTKREKLTRVLELLEKTHGPRPWRRAGPCLDVLVRAMLAQNTNVANARSGYRQLRRRFASWTQVMNAPVRDVQRQIAVCGLARMRARRLQNMLRIIKAQRGRLDLDHLGVAEPQTAYEYLTSFFGIGPRTAACTLLFAFGMPLFPVDNGVRRMAKRLRLMRPNAGHDQTSQTIARHLEPSQFYPLHVLMFGHAKQVCRPRNPKCAECRLNELCPYGKARLRHRPVEPELRPSTHERATILSRYASSGVPKRGVGRDDEERTTGRPARDVIWHGQDARAPC